MEIPLSRRQLLAAAPAAALGGFLLDPRPVAAGEAQPVYTESVPSAAVPPEYPTQEHSVVREVVAVSHGNVERVRELVTARPELSRAAWDWGFGDWESALGAASHVGNREIVEILIAHGARPDLFTAAMLGQLEVVRAAAAARPGIQRQHGPHGITLLAHARAGGDPAAAVAAYLEGLGEADLRYADQALPEPERQALLGTYAFGPGPADRFEVALDRRGAMTLQRGDGTPRVLFHQGGGEYHPAGAPSARIRFARDGGRATALAIHNPGLVVTAERVGAG